MRRCEDPGEFAKAKVGDWGHSLVWPSGAEAGADALWLETLAATRREDARAFLEWRLRHGLSLTRAAEALGLSRRMVAYYSNGEKPVPKTVLLACRGWDTMSTNRPKRPKWPNPKHNSLRSVDMNDLEAQFDRAMFDVYRRAKAEAKYNATIFLQMLTDNGGLRTAKTLINAVRPSDGYTALYLRERLDLTVEAVVVENPKWHPLFEEEELERARKRLRDYEYSPPARH